MPGPDLQFPPAAALLPFSGAGVRIHDLRELPAVHGAPPFAWTLFWLCAALLALAAASLLSRLRSTAVPPAPCGGDPQGPLAALTRPGEAPDPLRAILALDPVLRAALARRAGVDAVGLTSADLLERCLAAGALPGWELEAARELLCRCDRVKYGAHLPDASEAERVLGLADSLLWGGGGETR